MKSGAYFVFIDRGDGETKKKVEELIERLELDVVGDNGVKGNMDTDEEKSELKEFSDAIGKMPRLTWDARWQLARKS